MRMRQHCGTLLLLFTLVRNASSKPPTRGKAAPPLRLTKLIQALPSAHADWNPLRGKVVVLECWGTWCAPCIASIPHLNQLVAAVKPEKVRFIFIDDEDPKTILSFLEKKPISGLEWS